MVNLRPLDFLASTADTKEQKMANQTKQRSAVVLMGGSMRGGVQSRRSCSIVISFHAKSRAKKPNDPAWVAALGLTLHRSKQRKLERGETPEPRPPDWSRIARKRQSPHLRNMIPRAGQRCGGCNDGL